MLATMEPLKGGQTGPTAREQTTERLEGALRQGNLGRADRIARAMACLQPDAPVVAKASRILPAGEFLDTRASFGRMVQCLEPNQPVRARERIHRSIKANRPDLMPPHWMRDVMYEAEKLQALIQDDSLEAALAYLRNPDLAGHRHYMPRFRALRHFVLFNADPAYRDGFIKNSLVVTTYKGSGREPSNETLHETVLQSLTAVATWRDVTDTVTVSDESAASADKVRKRIRAGTIGNENLPKQVVDFRSFILSQLRDYWLRAQDEGMLPGLFGFNKHDKTHVISLLSINLNEILEGPVLGPHYHSGFRYDEAHFALLSGVYYPRTVPQNDETKAGYLELGRPDFELPFEPICITHRPIAGDLLLFPAFAYHGVIPIDQAPRYSVNVDIFLKPKNAETWSVSEFFDDPT